LKSLPGYRLRRLLHGLLGPVNGLSCKFEDFLLLERHSQTVLNHVGLAGLHHYPMVLQHGGEQNDLGVDLTEFLHHFPAGGVEHQERASNLEVFYRLLARRVCLLLVSRPKPHLLHFFRKGYERLDHLGKPSLQLGEPTIP
jgi:hypothetical protein